jgi:hypothetical protein
VALAKEGKSAPWADVIWASSSHPSSTGIQNAIDGNNGTADSGNYTNFLHTASAGDDNPEVRLDLGAVQYVKTVKVYNRGGNCGASQCAERFDGARIKTSTAEDCMSADVSTYTNQGAPHDEDTPRFMANFNHSSSHPNGQWYTWSDSFETLSVAELRMLRVGGISVSGEWRDQGWGNIVNNDLKLVLVRDGVEVHENLIAEGNGTGDQRGSGNGTSSNPITTWWSLSDNIPGSFFDNALVDDKLRWKVYTKQNGHKKYIRDFVAILKKSAEHAPGNLVTLDIGENARCVMIDQDYKPAGETYKMINIFEFKVEGDDQKAAYTCGTDHQWNYGDQPTCTPIETSSLSADDE